MSQDESNKIIQQIATQLGENTKIPLTQIGRVVEHCGVEFAETLLKETLEIEANGGLMINDGSRRRTPGGVYFYLVRGRVNKELREKIFGPRKKTKKFTKPQQKGKGQKSPVETVSWDGRMEILQPLLEAKGPASNVKVTVIGRPGKIDTSKKDLVVTVMEYAIKNPALPKGVPTPPSEPTTYTVYIAAKQWKRVAEAIEDPEDTLIIEGTAAYDPEIQGIAVFTQSVTTKLLQRQKRDSQAAKAAAEGNAPAAPAAPPAPQKQKPPTPAAPPQVVEVDMTIPEGMPADAVAKLTELHTAVAAFRQKLNEMNSAPEGKQFSINMTQKLLKNAEDQIATLVAQYSS